MPPTARRNNSKKPVGPTLFDSLDDTPAAAPLSNKLRGGYYTPSLIAEWLCRWAIRTPTDRVLEPSCGDGAILVAAGKRLADLRATPANLKKQLVGVELVASEAATAERRLATALERRSGPPVQVADFFRWHMDTTAEFDAVVGNPPFIRYQNFPEPARELAMRLMTARGLRPNRLTNIWVPFVVGAADRLTEGGRLAFVLPAELLQVTYAGQLRIYLANHFAEVHIVACNQLLFANAEQEVVLVLADGYRPTRGEVLPCRIRLTETNSVTELLALEPDAATADAPELEHSTEKWLKYFLSPREVDFMRALRRSEVVAPLSAHASVDVGVVTGRNEFFVVNRGTVERHDLSAFAAPLAGRSSQLKGAILSRKEWEELSASGLDVHLLQLVGECRPPLTAGATRYIREGERAGCHTGYKCSIRAPWYSVPSVWSPDCFLFRQIYDFPRVVVNDVGATSTDTVHRMRCRGDARHTAGNVYTHLSAASAEIEGRSYGGGVLELEPTEAERLLMPAELQCSLPIDEVDRLVRAGRLADVLTQNDELVLRPMGLTRGECDMLRAIWDRMRTRRTRRRG